ncbi:hypothetical protein [Nocardioides ferulae]|uniref:hypothetical protein n=1 Tax=Nocardioides ferulae TaxID=2340821 RepID=UPI000F8674B3|nr:hypothetical protein [Nocardioides ferulae]
MRVGGSAVGAVAMAIGLLLGLAGPGAAGDEQVQRDGTVTAVAPVTAQTTAKVTWKGWRGVRFGTPLKKAQKKVGGDLFEAGEGTCGDVLTTGRATLDGHAFRDGSKFGNISPRKPLTYPLGLRSTMTPKKVKRLIRAGGLSVTTREVDLYGDGNIVVYAWAVGPKGRTLYFDHAKGGKDIYRFGLAATKKSAKAHLYLNGC